MIDFILNTRYVEKGNSSNVFADLKEAKAWYEANGKNGPVELVKEDYYTITNYYGKTPTEIGNEKGAK
jgi:hypothetical protein